MLTRKYVCVCVCLSLSSCYLIICNNTTLDMKKCVKALATSKDLQKERDLNLVLGRLLDNNIFIISSRDRLKGVEAKF